VAGGFFTAKGKKKGERLSKKTTKGEGENREGWLNRPSPPEREPQANPEGGAQLSRKRKYSQAGQPRLFVSEPKGTPRTTTLNSAGGSRVAPSTLQKVNGAPIEKCVGWWKRTKGGKAHQVEKSEKKGIPINSVSRHK